MDPIFSFLAPVALVIIGYTVGSVKIINEGNVALVERLGQYHRKLEPGLNFIIPLLDAVVLEETTREKVLSIEPQQAITKDNVSLKADAVIYWQIIELEKVFYSVEDIESAIENLVVTTLRSAIGQLELEQTYASRATINQALLQQLDEAIANWGVKVTRVEVREITPAKTVMESLELERAAESKKRAAILEAEGTVRSVELLTNALQAQPLSREVLQYLVAQRYVDASQQLSASPNSKVVFMDPKALTEAITNIMGHDTDTSQGHAPGTPGSNPGTPNGSTP
jgi:regulator of protease activity HflC (stomatin/prohibitin superfamily)